MLARGRPSLNHSLIRRRGIRLVTIALLLWSCAHNRGAHDDRSPLEETEEEPSPVADYEGRKRRVQVVEIGIPAENFQQYEDSIDESIGLGLSSLLIERLFETGRFDLLEGEDELLERHRTLWRRTEDGFYAEDQPLKGMEVPEFLVDVELSYTTLSSRKFSLGILTTYVQKLEVTVNVCMRPISTGERLCRKGEGEAEQRGRGAFFIPRSNPDEFKKTAAGLATKRAMQQAVDELVEGISPEN